MKKLIQSMSVVLIAAIAISAQISNNGLVAWFPFTGSHIDGSTNGIVLDSVLEMPVLTADRNGVANAAYEFDGTHSGFKNPTSTKLPLGNPNLTISAWIYAANGGVPRVITSWGTDTTGQNKEIVFYRASINGNPYLGLTNGVDSIVAKLPAGSGETWLHVAVTVNLGSAKFYVDGTPSAAQAITLNIQDGAAFSIATDMTSRLSGINYFGGYLDDIAIYNRALTDQEITYLKSSKSVRNSAPAFTSTPIITSKVLEAYAYSIAATDADNHAVTITVPVKPAGMTYASNKLTWNPSATQKGANQVTIVAKDALGDSTVQSFTITVEAANNTAPSFTSVAPVIAKSSEQYTYNVITKDAENQKVTLSLKVKPNGMTISGSKISWTPTNEQAGKNVVTIVAKDESNDSTIQNFEITVEPTTSITQKVIPQKILNNGSTQVHYLLNGRACPSNNFKGLVLNKNIKRIVIR